MKLAEALILRSDLQKRTNQLSERIIRNSLVQEGEKPPEDPNALLAEYEDLSDQLEALIGNINRTNLNAQTADGAYLVDALAERDILDRKFQVYLSVGKAASINQQRYSQTEIKFKSAVDVRRIQKKADDIAKRRRELDTSIQEANWLNELVK